MFDSLGPLRAGKDARIINFVNCTVARALVHNLFLRAADAHGKVLSRHPRHCAHPGYLEQIGDVLRVVDLVEERLFVRIDIHAHHKEIL